MPESSKSAGDFFASSHVQLRTGHFIITEGAYPPGLRIERHDHELASLSIVLTGGYEERFGRRLRHAEPGSVIVHPEGEDHDEVHDPIRTRLLTVELSSATLRQFRPELRVFDDAWHRVDLGATAAAFHLRCELSRANCHSEVVIESLVLDLLSILDCGGSAGATDGTWLSRVRDCIEADCSAALSISALSDVAGVHPVHMARAFKKRFGCSIGAYVRRLQVGRAALMLEAGSNPLSQIAYEAGFSDQSHMTRRLRAAVGITPGEWQRRAKRPNSG